MSSMIPSIVAPPYPQSAAVPTDSIWRLSVERYHDMIRNGILTEDDPIELLEGWLVEKMTKHPPHNVATGLVQDAFVEIKPVGWLVKMQESITLEDSEPEPDVAVVRGKRRDYNKRNPNAQEIGLLVEVADASLRRDRGIKKRIYARAGIAVYWIVNLIDRHIEVYTEPSGPTENPDYARRQDFAMDDTITVVIDGQECGKILVKDLLP